MLPPKPNIAPISCVHLYNNTTTLITIKIDKAAIIRPLISDMKPRIQSKIHTPHQAINMNNSTQFMANKADNFQITAQRET